jgi:hypothetical protein
VSEGEATDVRRLIHLALAMDKRLKLVTVVDDDVDIRDPREVAWALATRFQPDRDTVILSGMEGYVIDPSCVPAAPARAWAWTPRAAAVRNSIRSRFRLPRRPRQGPCWPNSGLLRARRCVRRHRTGPQTRTRR